MGGLGLEWQVKKLLDLGCGTGNYLAPVAPCVEEARQAAAAAAWGCFAPLCSSCSGGDWEGRRRQVQGLDYNPGMLEQCAAKVSGARHGPRGGG